jgi:hypothetical protein
MSTNSWGSNIFQKDLDNFRTGKSAIPLLMVTLGTIGLSINPTSSVEIRVSIYFIIFQHASDAFPEFLMSFPTPSEAKSAE